jgi:hypothetical protein
MKRSLKEVLELVKDVKPVYDAYKSAAADGQVSLEEGLGLAGQVFAVLVKHEVTVGELQELLGEVGPLLALFQ